MTRQEDPEDFTPEELDTWSTLATLLEWLPAVLDAQLQRDSEISHFEFGVLFALSQAEGGTLRLSELASYANGTLSRLSRAVARLEAKDWVRRAPDPHDGRSNVASLTEQGQDAVRRAAPGHVALVRRLVFDSLSRSQAQQLGASARRVNGAIRSEQGWRPRA
ncbi:MarR family winged helix-turn-helix transcriptional regulator [Microbacterium marinilacus]|uniref:MarR family winged helix-turn-helix transcriptional regulator n=1 Tax=Microbacterium marinilacus TaxID=415209 RepID=A0ABP7B1R0_9MICO|nr:MarR family transcriptional regulator [Microbacterium marinilacus]MBY0688607.1 MarR family transcriptional regulator [Microbacterium marinilacus]